MKKPLRSSIGALAMLAAMACGRADATPNAELERDLEQTRVAEFEMANRNAKKTDVVSATERIPVATRTPTRRAPAPQNTPDNTMSTGVTEATDTSQTAPRPRPTQQTPKRQGPYKTVDEIIRNAPFPIKP